MRLTWTLCSTAILLSVAAGLTGCSASDGTLEKIPGVGVPGEDANIAFESEGGLTIAPGETVEISVVATPPNRYAIKFLLVGDALDASLDVTDVIADANGRATVRLRAPKTATYFAVRATIKDGKSDSIRVAVSDQGFGTLTVLPDYQGQRQTRDWVTSVVTGTCESLEASFPNDPEGPPPLVVANGKPIVIEDVPVGPNLAVFVRAGHYMWGCEDESDLVANENVDVDVRINDKPLELGTTVLDLTLALEVDEEDWPVLVTQQRATLIDAFLGNMESKTMLLAAMESVSSDPQAFAVAAMNNDWLNTIGAHLTANGVDWTASMTAWLDAGLQTEPPEIRATVTGVPDAPEHALLTLLQVGSASPSVMDVPSEYVMGFAADPDDTVRLSGTLFWMPSRYFGHVIAREALAQNPSHTSYEDVLRETAQCDTLSLGGLMGCDDTCVADLCAAGLAERWQAALEASADALRWGELPFQSSGASRFDDVAMVTGFKGAWLGQLVTTEASVQVTGLATADNLGQPPAK